MNSCDECNSPIMDQDKFNVFRLSRVNISHRCCETCARVLICNQSLYFSDVGFNWSIGMEIFGKDGRVMSRKIFETLDILLEEVTMDERQCSKFYVALNNTFQKLNWLADWNNPNPINFRTGVYVLNDLNLGDLVEGKRLSLLGSQTDWYRGDADDRRWLCTEAFLLRQLGKAEAVLAKFNNRKRNLIKALESEFYQG